jgi:7-cyano-7-deazaguanine synthase
MSKKAIVIFSGGPDSTAAALWAISQGYEIELLTFQFKHKAQYGELRSAFEVAKALNAPHTILDFKSPLGVFPPKVVILMHAGTPKYDATSNESSLLPFGAGIILSMASSYALTQVGVETVIWGATRSDAVENSDYTQEFADKLSDLISFSAKRNIKIEVPFSSKNKYQLLEEFKGKEDLFSLTWSCKEESTHPCGICKSCVARRLAAQLANIKDATPYKNKNWVNPLSSAQLGTFGALSVDERHQVLADLEKSPKTAKGRGVSV